MASCAPPQNRHLLQVRACVAHHRHAAKDAKLALASRQHIKHSVSAEQGSRAYFRPLSSPVHIGFLCTTELHHSLPTCVQETLELAPWHSARFVTKL